MRSTIVASIALCIMWATHPIAQEAQSGGAEQAGKAIGKTVDNMLDRFDIKKAFEDVRQDISKLRNDVMGKVREYSEVQAETWLVSTGQTNVLPETTGQFIGCRDTNSWAKQKCLNAKIVLKEHYKTDGPSCVRSIVTITCIKN